MNGVAKGISTVIIAIIVLAIMGVAYADVTGNNPIDQLENVTGLTVNNPDNVTLNNATLIIPNSTNSTTYTTVIYNNTTIIKEYYGATDVPDNGNPVIVTPTVTVEPTVFALPIGNDSPVVTAVPGGVLILHPSEGLPPGMPTYLPPISNGS